MHQRFRPHGSLSAASAFVRLWHCQSDQDTRHTVSNIVDFGFSMYVYVPEVFQVRSFPYFHDKCCKYIFLYIIYILKLWKSEKKTNICFLTLLILREVLLVWRLKTKRLKKCFCLEKLSGISIWNYVDLQSNISSTPDRDNIFRNTFCPYTREEGGII